MALAEFFKNDELQWQLDVDDWKDLFFLIRNRIEQNDIVYESINYEKAGVWIEKRNGDDWFIEVHDWKDE